MVYDTGSGYLTVKSNFCDNTCKTKAYDMRYSNNGNAVDGKTFSLSVRLSIIYKVIVWLG